MSGSWLALWLACAVASSALEDARALLDDNRPSEALSRLEQSLSDGQLSQEELGATYALLGRAYGTLGRGQQAQRAFAHALRVTPGWRLEEAFDNPEVRGPYEAALAGLPGEGEVLSAEVSLVEREGRRGMRVSLRADDLELVAGARVLLDDAPLTTLPLSRAEAEVFYPLDPRSVRGALRVQLTDEHGNELARLPVDIVIERTSSSTGAAPQELRWLALGGGTLIGLGAVGITALGLWFAAVDGGDLAAPEGARTVGLIGVGVATGVIALGGTLVVLDFVLAPGE